MEILKSCTKPSIYSSVNQFLISSGNSLAPELQINELIKYLMPNYDVKIYLPN